MIGLVVKRHPVSTLMIPAAVLLVLTGLGVYGTLAGAQSHVNNSKDIAYSLAYDTSISFALTVQQVRLCCMP